MRLYFPAVRTVSPGLGCRWLLFGLFFLVLVVRPVAAGPWKGVLRDAAGKPAGAATVVLQSVSGAAQYSAETSASGEFSFGEVSSGSYSVTVKMAGMA